MPRRKSLIVVAGIVVAAASLFLAFRKTDLSSMVEHLATANYLLAIPFLGCVSLFYWLKVYRWQALLDIDGLRPTRAALFGPMMIGFAANNVLPLRIGELVRIFVGAKRTSIAPTTVLASIVIERFFDGVALLVLAAIASLADTSNRMDHPVMPYLAAIICALLVALLIVTFLFPHVTALASRFAERSGGRGLKFLAEKLQSLEKGMQPVRDPARTLIVLLNSVVQWAFMAGAVLLACYAVNIDIAYSTAVYLLLLIAIAISVPSTPGFVGVIEYSFVLGLGGFGVDPSAALSAAIFYHVLTWSSVTLVGSYFVQRYSLSWATLRDSAPQRNAV